MPLNSQVSIGSEISQADTEEMRKLEQEFEKKMQRAKKSYGTRMDNLHRSKEEAEAQHQMTLEKHEKERVEFEKRVRLAEEEQTRRLNQIQKEFIEKKNEARQQRAKQPSTGTAAMQNGNGGDSSSGSSRPPLHGHGGHKRSSSHFDASLQHPSPMITDHKRNSSVSDLPDASSQTLMDSLPQPQQQQPGGGTEGRPGASGGARERSESTSS